MSPLHLIADKANTPLLLVCVCVCVHVHAHTRACMHVGKNFQGKETKGLLPYFSGHKVRETCDLRKMQISRHELSKLLINF